MSFQTGARLIAAVPTDSGPDDALVAKAPKGEEEYNLSSGGGTGTPLRQVRAGRSVVHGGPPDVRVARPLQPSRRDDAGWRVVSRL